MNSAGFLATVFTNLLEPLRSAGTECLGFFNYRRYDAPIERDRSRSAIEGNISQVQNLA